MYKKALKDVFLEQFSEDTQEVYKRIFKLSSKMEEKLNKDVCDFSREQFEEFMLNYLKPKTKQSARTYCNVLSSYVQWAMKNKYSSSRINVLRRRQDYFYNFVINQNSLYLTKDELDSIIFFLVNSQDGFPLKGLFYGIEGTQLSELLNLKIGDIIEDKNQIIVRDKDGNIKRTVDVDSETILLAKVANNERIYYKKNREMDYLDNVKDYVELSVSDYILRSGNTRKKEYNKPISYYTVLNRLEMIRGLEDFEGDYNNNSLTTKNIVNSGMIYEAKKILDRDGVLERKQIEEICSKFGRKYKWALKDFLNEETVRELYPE